MAQANTFPTFIRAEYDGSSGGFRDFERSAQTASANVKRQFETDMEEVKSTVANALTMTKNAFGAHNIDTAGRRQATEEAQTLTAATRNVANTTEDGERREGDLAEETRKREGVGK